ncbi:diacylglycerol kinase family protein [Vampirovibrio sp.]|uniref:diacylglycerol/lipid kinase family protein n=1 Tax=Vampirovibrio sp. TaxID=2717857 RepID=UPI0035940B00
MTRILLIINPNAGQTTVAEFEEALAAEMTRLQDIDPDRGAIQIDKLIPESPEQMRTTLRQQCAQNLVDILGVVGGDGTIMEVLPVLVEFPAVKLALIAYGTGNLLAVNLGIPKDFAGAIDTLLTGRPRRIDMARINNDYFALLAGVGAVADIMESTPRADKKRFGILAYVINGIRTVWSARRSRFKITTENRTFRARGVSVLVSNAASFLGPCVPLTPDAEPDDGLLDVCIIRSRSNRDYFSTLLEAILQPASTLMARNIVHFKTRKLRIESTKTLNVQADGNIIGTTPVDIEIICNRLQVMVPLQAFEGPSLPKEDSKTSLLDTLKCYLETARQTAQSGLTD